MAACVFALAIFCIPVEQGVIDFTVNPLVAVAKFDRAFVHHSIYFRHDDPWAGDNLDQRRCVGNQCVHYRASTENAPAARVRLTLVIQRVGDRRSYDITLVADHEEQLESALEAIRIIDDQGAAGMTLQDLIG